MNREQRRKKQTSHKTVSRGAVGTTSLAKFRTRDPDFSTVPLATMCQSIQLLINELFSRGYPVYDFDNKTKFVQGIQIIQGKVFFLAAEEVKDHEKT